MNKRRKILLSVALLLLILASIVAVISSEASIAYGFNYDFTYRRINNEWVTVNWISNNSTDGLLLSVECQNSGLMDGTFNILMEFTNANLNTTNQPNSQISNSIVKFPMTLHGHELKTIDAHFTVADNISDFRIKILFESTQLLIQSHESNSFDNSVNSIGFAKDESGNSFHQLPPP